MFNRRRNQLVTTLNDAALALIAEAQTRNPADAASLSELATRIDEIRVGLAGEDRGTLDLSLPGRFRIAA